MDSLRSSEHASFEEIQKVSTALYSTFEREML